MGIAIAIMHQENGVVGVSWPDFPGCITGADTIEEAASKADATLSFHVAGMVEDGDPLPSSRSPAELWADPEFQENMKDGVLLYTRYELPNRSLRINISMEEALIQAIDRAAEEAGESRSAFLSVAAKERLHATGRR